MTYYQKYLKYKKKYLNLIRGGGKNENHKFLTKYYNLHKNQKTTFFGKNYILPRYLDGGSDHYVLHTEIDDTIYISFNIKQKIKKNEILEGKQNIDINLIELHRVNIIIENLNFLICKLNPHGIKKIIINIQECFKLAYDMLKTNLICNTKQFSYTNLFACSINIAFRRKNEDGVTKFVGLDKDRNGELVNTGINGEENTDDGSCLCTFIYDHSITITGLINANRAFMATKISEDNNYSIQSGSYEFITKAIYIPDYYIFNVHFDDNDSNLLNCTNFIEKIYTNSIFKINHIAPNKPDILSYYKIADDILQNYNEEITFLYETSAYDYINKKLDAKYNDKFTIIFNRPCYILGDFNINPNDIDHQMQKFNNFKTQEILEEISVKYKFYTDDNTDAIWNLDRMIQISSNNWIKKAEVDTKEHAKARAKAIAEARAKAIAKLKERTRIEAEDKTRIEAEARTRDRELVEK